MQLFFSFVCGLLMRCRATLRGWKQTDSEAGLQPRPQHHLFGRGPSAPVAQPMMKCQLVIVPAKHPHLRGEGGREDGGGRELTGREMTPWIPTSRTPSLIQFIFYLAFPSFSCSCSGYQAAAQAQWEYSAVQMCLCTFVLFLLLLPLKLLPFLPIVDFLFLMICTLETFLIKHWLTFLEKRHHIYE